MIGNESELSQNQIGAIYLTECPFLKSQESTLYFSLTSNHISCFCVMFDQYLCLLILFIWMQLI